MLFSLFFQLYKLIITPNDEEVIFTPTQINYTNTTHILEDNLHKLKEVLWIANKNKQAIVFKGIKKTEKVKEDTFIYEMEVPMEYTDMGKTLATTYTNLINQTIH